jgi:hypothetical protein
MKAMLIMANIQKIWGREIDKFKLIVGSGMSQNHMITLGHHF